MTSAEYRFTVLDQIQAIGIAAQIVLESARRNSAAAVATPTELAFARDEQAAVDAIAADHIVQDGAPLSRYAGRRAWSQHSGGS